METPPFHLSLAGPEDDPLLEKIYASTREDELKLTPWTEPEKAAFCQMQHRAQDSHYRRHYPTAEFLLIIATASSQALGRVYVDRWEKEIRIMDLAILPEFRSQGIGSRILTNLITEATEAGKLLSIHVERQNPALRLYLRHGFQPAGENGFHLLLHRLPAGTFSQPPFPATVALPPLPDPDET